ncbi:hypothetical protein EAG_02475, partial [Camponotus floridanus]
IGSLRACLAAFSRHWEFSRMRGRLLTGLGVCARAWQHSHVIGGLRACVAAFSRD